MAKRVGTSTGGVESSPRYRRKKARQRREEQAAWDAQNGPVLIRIGDREIYAKSQAKKDIQAARSLLLKAMSAGEDHAVRPGT